MKYVFDSNFRKLIIKDCNRLDENPYKINLFNYYYQIIFNKAFMAIVSYRIRRNNIITSKIFDIFFPPKVDLELDGEIKGGLRINHGQSSVIVFNNAGENSTIYQNVTCGRNKNHINKNNNSPFNCYPTIGNNVTIYSGAVIIGGMETTLKLVLTVLSLKMYLQIQLL